MGVRQYHSRFRAAIRQDGVDYQKYFDSEPEAYDFIDEIKRKRPAQLKLVGNCKKRKDAIYTDLPIGLTETVHRKMMNDKTYEYPVICSIVFLNGVKIGVVATHYGNMYSRDEAIALTIIKRENKIKEKQND